jgi:hypothetical protein
MGHQPLKRRAEYRARWPPIILAERRQRSTLAHFPWQSEMAVIFRGGKVHVSRNAWLKGIRYGG